MNFYSTLTSHCKEIKAIFWQVADGTFIEEPGSGAVAIVEDKQVSVGTLDWVRR